MRGRKSHGCPENRKAIRGRCILGGEQIWRPEHQRMTTAPKKLPYRSCSTDIVECRAALTSVKAEVSWEETSMCTRRTAGVRVQASRERFAEITSGRANSQQ
jgi:hypothetical protein